MAYLAFDFGMTHIGVAVAERRAGTASGIATIQAKRGIPVWDALDKLVGEWRPEGFVVGLPLNMDDTESEMSRAARRFGTRLNQRYEKEVHFADERLSTFEAVGRKQSRHLGLKPSRRADRRGDHATAAQIIAETWLNTEP